MIKFNVGSSIKWFCWDCYKKSQYEVLKSDMVRQKQLYKIHQSRKKHK